MACPSKLSLRGTKPESLVSSAVAGRFLTSALVSLTASKVFKTIKIATFSVSLYIFLRWLGLHPFTSEGAGWIPV